MNCSKSCVNQTCDRRTGVCLDGCKYGSNCDPGIFSISDITRHIYNANFPFYNTILPFN